MKKILLVLLLLLPGILNAQNWQWARSPQCVDIWAYSFNDGLVARTDIDNNIYISGISVNKDSMCFPPYKVYNRSRLTYPKQLFVAKYNAAGIPQWAIATENSNAAPLDIAISSSSVYLLGSYEGDSTRFCNYLLTNPHPRVLYSCYFLAKLDLSGNLIWIKNGINMSQTTPYLYNDCIGSIAIDSKENIYLASSFADTSVQIGSYRLSKHRAAILDTGTTDLFVAKYDSSGNVIWAKSFGGDLSDNVSVIKVDNSGKVLITGNFQSTSISFGSASLTWSVSPLLGGTIQYFNYYLTELDTSGNVVWATSDKGASIVYCMDIDSSGSIYLGGTFQDTSNTIGSFTLDKPNQSTSGFLVKYGAEGTVDWVNCLYRDSFPSALRDVRVYSITIRPCNNNVWITAGFYFNVNLNSSTKLQAPRPTGLTNDPLFLASYTPNDSLVEYHVFPSGGDDISSIAIDNNDYFYLFGDFAIDTFTLGVDTFYSNDEELFLAKFKPQINCDGSIDTTGTTHGALIKYISAQKTVLLFPNPANNYFTIIAPYNIANLTITNLLGQKVFTNEYNSNKARVDIADLPAGIYLIRINGSEVRKFVKL